MPTETADVILVGGGLANGLLALRLKAARPALRVLMLEREAGPDRGHTWSYFATDVPGAAAAWLRPLQRRGWDGYDVRFPGAERSLSTGYASIGSEELGEAVAAALGEDLRRNAAVAALAPDHVILETGERLSAPLVVDGRGARPSAALHLGFQKFQGLELRLKAPHGLERPVIMDAAVAQLDGYRFVYLLPFDEKTLLVEDTRYSRNSELDVAVVEADAQRYVRARGWAGAQLVRREAGVLPVALDGDIDTFWAEQPEGVPSIGMRAALFHPTTGYSLPDAVRTAEMIAAAPELESRAVRALVEARSKALWRRRGFYRALNRMMFLAGPADERWRVLARFYRLPQPLIERFYAGETSLADRFRILAGRPPVPIGPALAALARRKAAA